MFWLAFFHGDLLTGIFASDSAVIAAGAEYLKAYGIDILLVCFVFCFIGYFNGMERTRFVMIQGVACSFLIRLPIAFIMSRRVPPVLFHIGLGVPASTAVQILLCVIFFFWLRRKTRQESLGA